jgi:uncharacterized protein
MPLIVARSAGRLASFSGKALARTAEQCLRVSAAAMLGLAFCGPAAAADPALEQAIALYEQGDFPAAQARFDALGHAGNAAALHNLAVMHLRGEASHPSVDTGRQLLEEAADRGFVTARYELGELFEGHQLGPPDLARALAAYRRAAEAGSVDAQVATATAYFMGRGTAPDSGQAAHWYRLAANAGEVGSQYILGALYEKGDGVGQDLRLARYWYAAAALAGDVAAPFKVKEIESRLAAETPGGR